ncbi:MAG TPA: HAMP domain-containing sensor histidine kinase [Polyangiaceae bacterium]|nr:HAMP domain-containing sensor histidine kinase [Polyangiaceae bacterium]HNZ20977.1 HAMP domain-containing sensor histidine kinase [Polyangiaceae bacterium]HOD23874.1 HAMP domain-containing sensor histidine kinase [Polyangiaceae bacterium]HOE48861.1 HAMP domain-containing sensor histidine kinase [Polyangiaceae bacterium]HOG98847.1 HAMP domain-containing sensor histidine kinase [Polyangiaceae bacterium]
MASFQQRIQRLRLPLVPLLPAIVVAIGAFTAIVAGFLGLAHLRSMSDGIAQDRADVLASTLAARIRTTDGTDQPMVIRRAARRSGAEILLLTHDGISRMDDNDAGLDTPQLLQVLIEGRGEVITRIGRAKYAARPIGPPFQNLALVVFVSAPAQPEGATSLIRSLLVVTALLLGVAVFVAFVFVRELRGDVDFVRSEIDRMAEPDAAPTGRPIRVRMTDQVGVLTHAFNLLVDRFAAAERAYQLDLDHAASLDRDRAAFLGVLSHELRTPLNAILGFTDVLLSEVDGPLDADTRENLEHVRASGSHLRGLIDDILELSALESGQLRLSRNRVDLRAVADDVMREASARIGSKNIALHVEGPSPAYAYVDERRMWQILSNLVSNAIKFTTSGDVRINIALELGQIHISVSDTGPGIDAEDREAIFDEFRQVGPLTARAKGTGLGLFIARRLVTMHGGTIMVESEVGQGSCFHIRLPAWSVDTGGFDGFDVVTTGLLPVANAGESQ